MPRKVPASPPTPAATTVSLAVTSSTLFLYPRANAAAINYDGTEMAYAVLSGQGTALQFQVGFFPMVRSCRRRKRPPRT